MLRTAWMVPAFTACLLRTYLFTLPAEDTHTQRLEFGCNVLHALHGWKVWKLVQNSLHDDLQEQTASVYHSTLRCCMPLDAWLCSKLKSDREFIVSSTDELHVLFSGRLCNRDTGTC